MKDVKYIHFLVTLKQHSKAASLKFAMNEKSWEDFWIRLIDEECIRRNIE